LEISIKKKGEIVGERRGVQKGGKTFRPQCGGMMGAEQASWGKKIGERGMPHPAKVKNG